MSSCYLLASRPFKLGDLTTVAPERSEISGNRDMKSYFR